MLTSKIAITSHDADQFQEFMRPMVGENRVAPARGNKFFIDVQACMFGRVNAFIAKSPSLSVFQEPPLPRLSFNIPLGRPFSIGRGSEARNYARDIHVLRSADEFNLSAPGDSRTLNVGIQADDAARYADRMNIEFDEPVDAAVRAIEWHTPAAQNLIHSAARSWALLHAPGAPALDSLYAEELEDELTCQMTLAALHADAKQGLPTVPADAALDRAEQYLCAHLDSAISRADMAHAAATSVRNLSRGFKRRWGMGPMEFLRERRLDAVFMTLLGAHPGEVTVSDVAIRFGFAQLGAFSGQYRESFGELPSETLAR